MYVSLGRPTLSECFPEPTDAHWPDTNISMLCHSQQLYSLVSMCCCRRLTHLLVLHDGSIRSMVPAMPRGPRYPQFILTENTSVEDFLLVLRCASDSFVPTTVSSSSRQTSSYNTFPHLVVFCLYGLEKASLSVLAALLEVMASGELEIQGKLYKFFFLHVVGFCNSQCYGRVLPERVRAAFALSTFLGPEAFQGTPVLQSPDPTKSNVINRSWMLRILDRGCISQEEVFCSPNIIQYLGHLLTLLRGSVSVHRISSNLLCGRKKMIIELLRVATALFSTLDSDHANISTVPVSSSTVLSMIFAMVTHLFVIRKGDFISQIVPDGRYEKIHNGPSIISDFSYTPNQAAMWDARVVRSCNKSSFFLTKKKETNFIFKETERGTNESNNKQVARSENSNNEPNFSYEKCRLLLREVIFRLAFPPVG